MTHHYIILLRSRSLFEDWEEGNDGRSIHVESFYEFTDGDGGDFPVMDYKTLAAADRIAERIVKPRFKNKINDLNTAFTTMDIRARYNTDIVGPLHVTSECAVTAEQMEKIINAKSEEELRRFIREGKLSPLKYRGI